MKIKIKWKAFLLIFAMLIGLFPTTMNVQAATTDTKDLKIVSESPVTAKQMKNWAKSKGATSQFMKLAELYVKYSSECGKVNPAIAYVQAAKETGYGKFGGVIDESYCNPCGLKTSQGGDDTDPNAHKKFDSWDEGVQAHMDHLALYAGVSGYPKSDSYDERQFKTIKGKVKTISDLGGKWAPSTSYGDEVAKLYDELLVNAGIKTEDKDNKSDKQTDTKTDTKIVAPGTQEAKPAAPNVKKVNPITVDNSTNISSSIGWKSQGGQWYYYKSDNTKATGWIKPDANWYYLNSNGSMKTGWLYDGAWYYLKSSGAMAKGWIQLNSIWYYLDNGGSMVTGLNNIDNKIYYFDASGSMKTGWTTIGDRWYYFGQDGGMKTGWIKDGNADYYLYDTGAMAKGWIDIDNTWYFLKNSGEAAKGWTTSGGNSYYLDNATGRMLVNTTVDGRKIDASGRAEAAANNNNNTNVNNNTSNNNVNTNNSKKTIVIDAGHNAGGDFGCKSTLSGVDYIETDLNMQVAAKLKAALESRGLNVVMTREEGSVEYLDETSSLNKRVDIANKTNACLYVSIHHNSFNLPNAYGVETYYSVMDKTSDYGGTKLSTNRLEESKKMAKLINDALASAVEAYNRGAKPDSPDGLRVLRNANMPAVLVEMGFLTNEKEAKRCADPAYQQKAANAIADVIAANYK